MQLNTNNCTCMYILVIQFMNTQMNSKYVYELCDEHSGNTIVNIHAT